MSSNNKPKGEAERLVRVIVFESGTSAELWVDEQNILQFANPKTAEARANAIRNVIRKVIEGRDRILTDMLSDSEAFHEGWRQGATAMKASIIENISKVWRDASVGRLAGKSWLTMVLEAAEPQPPSHDDSGEPLTPSPVHLRAQRLECFIRRLIRDSRAFGSEEPMASIVREAIEELEGLINE